MHRVVAIVVCIAALTANVANAQQKQGGNFQTCSEAHLACLTRYRLPEECEKERQWCLRTGTFANPKTKAVHLGLRKK
jgi:hypothetical protein